MKLKMLALLTAVAVMTSCGEPQPPIETGDQEIACSAKAQITNGLISMTFGDPCNIKLNYGEVRIGVQSNEGINWVRGSEFPSIEVKSKRNQTTATYSGLSHAPNLKLVISPNENRLLMEAEVCNPYPSEIAIAGLEVPSFAYEFGSTTNLGSEVILLQNGYNGWSIALALKKRFGDSPLPKCNGTICDNGNNNSIGDFSGISFWNATIAPKPEGPGLSIGVVSAKHLKSRVAIEHNSYGGPDIRLVAGATGDVITLGANECYSIDPVALVATFDPLMSALEHAAIVAEHNPPPAVPQKFESPAGWSSWYCLFNRVTEQDVLDHTRILVQEGYKEAGYKILQIDDGYEIALGDWRTNEKFPRGLQPLANDIKSYGLIPGIWVAPFAFHCNTDIVQYHPDWFVHDRITGGIYVYDDPLSQPLCALDVTHPEAANWLYQTMRSFKDAGFEYFKLDFLFLGAVEGMRFESITSLEAFHRGLEIIKDALGKDVFILACGHPFLATAGFAHAARTSSDITYSFINKPNFSMLTVVARTNAARFYSALWQIPDPDNLLLGMPYNANERTTSIAADALFGGIHILGDDLRTLSGEAKQLIQNPRLSQINKTPGIMIPVDLFYKPANEPNDYVALEVVVSRRREIPSLWLKKGADKRWLGVINWWDEPLSLQIIPAHVGASKDATLIDVQTLERIALPQSLPLSEHQGRIFEVEINP